MKWWSISQGYAERKRGAQAEQRLMLAYKNVFSRAAAADAELVIADLANFTGFYRVNGQGIPPDDRAFSDGMRAAFGRLFRFLNLSDEEQSALAQAAIKEAQVSATQGEF